jgi:hypothetical protein
MKNLNKVAWGVGTLSLLLVLAGPSAASAATSPSVGSESTFAIVSSTYTNSSNTPPETRITGNVCYTTPPVTAPVSVNGTTTVTCPAITGTDQNLALANLNGQADAVTCTNLGTNVVLAGTYTPGCYTASGTMDIVANTTVTLNGAGTFIFRPAGALTTGANSQIALSGGASACDVFWVPGGATTIGANSASSPTYTFAGNIFRGTAAGLSITLGHFVNIYGRLLAYGSTVTTNSNTIVAPTCAAPPPVAHSSAGGIIDGTINVVKTVINDNGGTKIVSDFPLFVNGTPVISGETNNFSNPAGVYTVTETPDPKYTRTFSGDCDATGNVVLNPGDAKFCIITNNDIGAPVVVPPVPPLIDVVKVPDPLALPGGPGPVSYTYTLKNIGTVPVTNITMVGDTCSPIDLVSGDTNGDSVLQTNETWVYTCATNLAQTTTNTIVATGWANGLSATDIASATVVVGAPIVPPLIHVTKVPSPLTLPAGGGMVTYTEKVTDPGTVPLSNVVLTDDKCVPVKYVSGDANGDGKLDPSETWTYTCTARLAKTTTNTVIASGAANGLTIRDIAIATVVVASAVPKLPNTGVAPMGNILALLAVTLGISVTLLAVFVIRKKRTA